MQFSKISLYSLLLLTQCYSGSSQDNRATFPKAYDLSAYQKINLNDDLEEVSGLEWVGEDQLWAIEDESSIIYSIDQETGKILKKRKFAKNKDIEDLLVIDNVAWVLQSNGTLYRVDSPLQKYGETTTFDFPIKGKRDLEAIVAMDNEPYLYVFCKVCKWDIGPDQASIFRFDLNTLKYDSEVFTTLNREDIQPLLKNPAADPLDIQPAAAAFHPIEKRLYVISSSGKWLLILDSHFKPEEVHELNPILFKQPEGITFDTKGNLYISNEAQDGRPNLLIFSYRP